MSTVEASASNRVSRTPAGEIHRFVREAFLRVGLPGDDAEIVAALMTRADLTGADAHGIFRLPQYIARIEEGGVARKPEITVERTAPATALVDGGNGMGHLVISRAVDTAIEIAAESGVAWVGARRSNHAGPAALYVEKPVARGMIAIYSVVASANHMPIWGGSEALLGTNPIAFGVPAGEEPPIVLDIATSVTSYGTVKNHVLNNEALEEGWMVNRETGLPITDPADVPKGVLLPIGGYKGSGICLLMGLLGGPLNRAAFGRDVVDFNADANSETNTGHFLIVLDVSRFLPLAEFKADIDRHIRDLRGSRLMPGHDRIRIPGEGRVERIAERSRDGVPLSLALVGKLDELARRLEIKPLAGAG
jgi:LDH2 family malate/lactate/ureidoglycolate dehydrogenase